MEAKKAILTAIRNKLIADSALTAYVAAAQIIRSNQKRKSQYPCIAIRIEGANDGDFSKSISGSVYISIYALMSDAPGERVGDYLDDIYDLVKNDLHNQQIELSDSNIGFDTIYESFGGSATSEDEIPNLYYLPARFTFTATKRSE